MPRGKKICPACEKHNGPRTYQCACGHNFNVKKGAQGGRKGLKIDWRKLERGDYIKVVQGSGPYWQNGEERESLGYHGVFKVKFRDSEGIGAYPAKGNGFCYIYMGEERPSKIAGMLRAHKIRKIDPKYVRNNK